MSALRFLEDGKLVTTEHLPADLTGKITRKTNGTNNAAFVLPPEGISFEAVELEFTRQALERCGGNMTQAARLLHISRDQLRYLLKKSGKDGQARDDYRIAVAPLVFVSVNETFSVSFLDAKELVVAPVCFQSDFFFRAQAANCRYCQKS